MLTQPLLRSENTNCSSTWCRPSSRVIRKRSLTDSSSMTNSASWTSGRPRYYCELRTISRKRWKTFLKRTTDCRFSDLSNEERFDSFSLFFLVLGLTLMLDVLLPCDALVLLFVAVMQMDEGLYRVRPLFSTFLGVIFLVLTPMTSLALQKTIITH